MISHANDRLLEYLELSILKLNFLRWRLNLAVLKCEQSHISCDGKKRYLCFKRFKELSSVAMMKDESVPWKWRKLLSKCPGISVSVSKSHRFGLKTENPIWIPCTCVYVDTKVSYSGVKIGFGIRLARDIQEAWYFCVYLVSFLRNTRKWKRK